MKHFGLIGKSLDHSFSSNYFLQKFKREGIHATYGNLELNSLDTLMAQLADKNWQGFNVTIPFKQEVIKYLDHLDPSAAEINAVNVVVKHNSGWIGYNTDYTAFMATLTPLFQTGTTALVFGNGGASRAIQYALKQLGISYKTVARQTAELKFTDLEFSHIANHKLLINCTPIGTTGFKTQELPIPMEAISDKHIAYDLVYNPEETPFLKQAKNSGARYLNGYDMLVKQAEESWQLWQQA